MRSSHDCGRGHVGAQRSDRVGKVDTNAREGMKLGNLIELQMGWDEQLRQWNQEGREVERVKEFVLCRSCRRRCRARSGVYKGADGDPRHIQERRENMK